MQNTPRYVRILLDLKYIFLLFWAFAVLQTEIIKNLNP